MTFLQEYLLFEVFLSFSVEFTTTLFLTVPTSRVLTVIVKSTFSPLFKGIAVGYAASDIAVGAEVEIEIHGRKIPAEVVKTPFYKNRV